MQLTQSANRLESAVEAQLRLGDPELASLGNDLLEVLRPAVRQTLMEVAEMAALEVSGQLSSQRVEVALVDGDPELRVTNDDSTAPFPIDATSLSSADDIIPVTAPLTLYRLLVNGTTDTGNASAMIWLHVQSA